MSSDRINVVISREGGDFSMDLIWAGLTRRFGQDGVVDYPPREKHRVAPRLVGDPERDYGAERKSLCYVSGCETHPVMDRVKLISMFVLGRVDRVFLDETEESFIHYMTLVGSLPPALHTHKVVVIAGHDRFRGIPHMTATSFGKCFEAMFIDDWQEAYDDLPFAHLINLSCNFDHLWDKESQDELLAEKKFDICFVGYNSRPVRKLVVDHLKHRWGHLNNRIMLEERQDEFSTFTRHDRYFRDIAQSKICINLPGSSVGGRALRFYEIPYVGSYMLSLRFKARLLDPFVDGEHCDYFDTLEELDAKIERALADDHYREMIAVNGMGHAEFHHGVDARMDYLFSILEAE